MVFINSCNVTDEHFTLSQHVLFIKLFCLNLINVADNTLYIKSPTQSVKDPLLINILKAVIQKL